MILSKSVYFIGVIIFLVSIFGKCSSYPSESVQFITKLAQKSSEDWESDVLEPDVLDIEKFYLKKPNNDVEYDQEVNNENLLSINEEKEVKEKYDKENENGNKRRIVRQVNTGYSGIYPTLAPRNPPNSMYPSSYQPAAGNYYGNVPNTYPSSQNSYNNPAYSQTGAVSNPASYRPPYSQQGQNPFLKNTTFTNPGYYNQGSVYNNQSNINTRYPPYNQNNNQHYPSRQPNNTYPTFQGNNYSPYGNNANRHTPTPVNQWTPGNTNNSRHTTPKYPNFNNLPNSFSNYSTPRAFTPTVTSKYPQYNPSKPPYQSYPHYNNTNSQNNYNRSNQWQNPQTQYNQGSNYPGYIPNDGRTSNVSGQNYSGYNPSSPYTQRSYSPNPSPNPYSQNYPSASTGNYNNPYNKEPEHFFYSPGSKDNRYDPRNNPSQNFSYSQ